MLAFSWTQTYLEGKLGEGSVDMDLKAFLLVSFWSVVSRGIVILFFLVKQQQQQTLGCGDGSVQVKVCCASMRTRVWVPSILVKAE